MNAVNANELKNARSERGSYGILYMSGTTVKKRSDNSDANVSIGTGDNDLHIGDLIFIDWDGDGIYDHTTVLYEDSDHPISIVGKLDGYDMLIFAGCTGGSSGVLTEALHSEIPSTADFVLRQGW